MKTSTFLFAVLSLSLMVSTFATDADAAQKLKTKSNHANERAMKPQVEATPVSPENAKKAVEIVNSAEFLDATKKNDVKTMKVMLAGTGVQVLTIPPPLPCLAPLAWQGTQIMQNMGNGMTALVWSVQCTGWQM
jgi:hypothetical protein